MVKIKITKTKHGYFIKVYGKSKEIGSVELYLLDNGNYRIRMLKVTDKHQSKGIGMNLMRNALELAGDKSVEVGCFHELFSFYGRLGFKVRSQNRKGYELIHRNL